MSEIKISTSRTNTTTHRAVVDQDKIYRLLSEEICRQIGVDTDAEHVVAHVRLNNRSMSYGTLVEAIVEVTIHHDAEPQTTEQ
ncbi:hypothetical protein [Paraburkholderia unamae]|uniref:Uncharacterized protein n=1 Tax=Paraburkholderia unamae TaxID=219649 RepID=A0ABX5KUE5_9BURK|nr:hypothetical protein [Paraburkholderia unamae]PVX86460.1 hypothetical protein C7402_102296 [Paraburkholderia unamae]